MLTKVTQKLKKSIKSANVNPSIIPKKTSKVATFRFTINPKMQNVLERLEAKYVMLDRTEIVKVALSKLAEVELDDQFDYLLPENLSKDSNPNAFETEEEAMAWLNQNKNLWRK